MTLIGQSFLTEHPELVNRIRHCTHYSQTANAVSLKIIGTVMLSIQIAGVSYRTLAHVSPRTPWEMILGVDFMRQFGIQVDFQNNLFKIPRCTNLFNVHKSVLPPFSEKVVKRSLSRRAKVDMTGTVYGKEFLHKKGLSCVEAYV